MLDSLSAFRNIINGRCIYEAILEIRDNQGELQIDNKEGEYLGSIYYNTIINL